MPTHPFHLASPLFFLFIFFMFGQLTIPQVSSPPRGAATPHTGCDNLVPVRRR